MKTSANGRRFIEAFEGLYLKTYDDGTGVLTIGYGHTTAAGGPKVYAGQQITEKEADQILSDDLAAVELDVERIIPGLRQCEFDALVSFQFNTGDLAKSSIPAKLKRGQTQDAMDTLLLYVNGGGSKMKGLVRRRKAERLMFLGSVKDAMDAAGARYVAEVPIDMPPVIKPDPKPAPKPVPAPRPSLIAQIIMAIIGLFRRK